MIKLDEDALVCDLAETYQIYDYSQLPLLKVAVFACGLREDSRIKQKLTKQLVSIDTMLLAGIVDRLSLSLWIQTKDGQKGVNRPKSVVDQLTQKEEKEEREHLVFSSVEEFEKYRKEFFAKMGGED